jgi:large subunit ribosomal protein L10
MDLAPILSGPLMLVTLPAVSPAHLKTIFSMLSPSPEFPAPKRRANPNYHEPAVQNGVHKLMLLGARVEGKVFDFEGAKWIGTIEGGLDGLRAQLVHLLQSVPVSVTNTLESAAKNLYFTMESRKTQLEDESKPKEEAPAV